MLMFGAPGHAALTHAAANAQAIAVPEVDSQVPRGRAEVPEGYLFSLLVIRRLVAGKARAGECCWAGLCTGHGLCSQPQPWRTRSLAPMALATAVGATVRLGVVLFHRAPA